MQINTSSSKDRYIKRDAHLWRLFQAAALIEVFERGGDLSAYGKPIDPWKVFGPEKGAEVKEKIKQQHG